MLKARTIHNGSTAYHRLFALAVTTGIPHR
jgi:hypothetical protein